MSNHSPRVFAASGSAIFDPLKNWGDDCRRDGGEGAADHIRFSK